MRLKYAWIDLVWLALAVALLIPFLVQAVEVLVGFLASVAA